MIYKGFYELEVWKEAKSLAVQVYSLTEQGKINKDFGLRDQIRRSVISISSNIAEGSGRGGREQFKYFLKVARGSCSELYSQLLIAQELGVLEEDINFLLTHIEILGKRISALIKKLKD